MGSVCRFGFGSGLEWVEVVAVFVEGFPVFRKTDAFP